MGAKIKIGKQGNRLMFWTNWLSRCHRKQELSKERMEVTELAMQKAVWGALHSEQPGRAPFAQGTGRRPEWPGQWLVYWLSWGNEILMVYQNRKLFCSYIKSNGRSSNSALFRSPGQILHAPFFRMLGINVQSDLDIDVQHVDEGSMKNYKRILQARERETNSPVCLGVMCFPRCGTFRVYTRTVSKSG